MRIENQLNIRRLQKELKEQNLRLQQEIQEQIKAEEALKLSYQIRKQREACTLSS